MKFQVFTSCLVLRLTSLCHLSCSKLVLLRSIRTRPRYSLNKVLETSKSQTKLKLKNEDIIDDFPTTSINVKNTQKRFEINKEKVTFNMKNILHFLQLECYHIDIWFCSDGKMRELNSEWRNKKKTTDILSFPVNEFERPEVFAEEYAPGVIRHLGDIVISPSYVHRQILRDQKDNDSSEEDIEDAGVSKAMAKVFTLEERIPLLLIHGTLHLLGYDHETPEDWAAMTQRESEIIAGLHFESSASD